MDQTIQSVFGVATLALVRHSLKLGSLEILSFLLLSPLVISDLVAIRLLVKGQGGAKFFQCFSSGAWRGHLDGFSNVFWPILGP